MTDQDKQTTTTDTAAPASSKSAEAHAATTPPKAKAKPGKTKARKGGGRGWRIVLVLLLVIGLFAAAGYYWGRPYYQQFLAQWSAWASLPQQQAGLAAEVSRLNDDRSAPVAQR